MKLRFTILVKDLFLWGAVAFLFGALYAEHVSARQFELATRHGVEQMFAQILGSH